MENTQYFNKPAQVMFADPDEADGWVCGIAYKDEIICACCGGIFNIGEVIDMATKNGIKQAIYPYSDWVDVRYEIMGSEWPEGFNVDEFGSKNIEPF